MIFAKTFSVCCFRKLLFYRYKWVLVGRILYFAKMYLLNFYNIIKYLSAYKINIYNFID